MFQWHSLSPNGPLHSFTNHREAYLIQPQLWALIGLDKQFVPLIWMADYQTILLMSFQLLTT